MTSVTDPTERIDPVRPSDSAKTVYTVHRGARYKVYATTNVSQFITHHSSDTRAAKPFSLERKRAEGSPRRARGSGRGAACESPSVPYDRIDHAR